MEPTNLFKGYVLECDGQEAKLIRPSQKKKQGWFKSLVNSTLEDRVNSWVSRSLCKKKGDETPPPMDLLHWIHFVSCQSEVFNPDPKISALRYRVLDLLREVDRLFNDGVPRAADA